MSNIDFTIIVLSGTFVTILLVAMTFILLFINHRKKFLHKQEVASLQLQFTQTLLQSQLEIKEQTLQQVSRELHDNLSQIASIIKINLNTLQLTDLSKASEKIEDTKNLTRQLLADLKALSVSLGSDRLKQLGLAKALEVDVHNINKTGQFIATFIQEGNLPHIKDEKAIILYRMAQEILNNMVKHSQSPVIKVYLYFNKNLFTLAFTDEGVGFDVAINMQNGGAGLTNLYTRAKMIDATLNINSQPNNGTQISIETIL